MSGNIAPNTLLLLATTEPWIAEARTAAAGLPHVTIEVASSGPDAVRRLAARGSEFSHVLAEPEFVGEMLPVLADLTSGEPGSGTSLIVVGPTPPRARLRRARLVPQPTRTWLAEALAADHTTAAAAEPLSPQELRDALANGGISVRYQPLVRMANRSTRSLEVLARLDHPTRGTLPPDLFVPPMERAGLGLELTRTVIQRAFDDWGAGKLAALGLFMALNFPLDVMLMPGALGWLEAKRVQAGIPADKIVIELTESQPVGDLSGISRAAEALRAYGYGLAIDDIGPGTRNEYRMLLDLPFTALKLDKGLVQAASTDDAARAFLATAIADGRRHGLIIVAEGIMNAALWSLMDSLGVDLAQGFLIGRPLPAAAVPLWVMDWRGRYPVLADQTAL